MTVLFVIAGLLLIILALLIWVVCLDGEVYDLKRYIDKIEEKINDT